MARRADHSREELYELALATAEEIVETDGFRGLTARNVADAIGYSPGTLYNVFTNLDDLIIHLNGRTLDRLYDLVIREKLTGKAQRDVKTLLHVYLKFLEHHRALWELMMEFRLPGGQDLPRWYMKKVEKVLSVLEQALAPLFPKNNKQKAQETARILWASLHGICSLATTGKLMVVTNQSMEAMANALVSNYLAGLKASARKSKSKASSSA